MYVHMYVEFSVTSTFVCTVYIRMYCVYTLYLSIATPKVWLARLS